MATYNVGSVVRIPITVRDIAGALVNPATVSLSIQLPSMATVGPFTPTLASLGNYYYDYATTASGHHIWRVTTSAPTSVGEGEFDVTLAYAAGGIVSLADAKQALNKTGTADDAEITAVIDAVTDLARYHIGEVTPVTYVESYDGGRPYILLRHTPVLSVTSVDEWLAGLHYTDTSQPPGSTTSQYGYSLDNGESGVLARRSSAGQLYPFLPGSGNILVTYVAGRSVVPAAIARGALEFVQMLWHASQQGTSGRGSASAGPYDMDASPNSLPGMNVAELPNRVARWWGPYIRVGGIA